MLDLDVLSAEIAAIIDERVAGAVQRAVAALPAPRDGTSVTVNDLAPVIAAAVESAVAAIPAPRDGRDADPAEIRAMVDEAVSALPAPRDGRDADPAEIRAMVDEAVAALPAPRDGASVTLADVEPTILTAVERAVAALPAPRDGRDADPAEIRAMVDEAVAALPAPRDGTSVTLADVEPTILTAVERAVAALPAPRDGTGLAGALIDRKGCLIITLSDGSLVDLGRVEGQDGAPGLGFDDMAIEQDGERGFLFRFTKGERTKEFRFSLPVLLDRGVYKAGETYQRGDCVTFGGSLWIAQDEASAKPDGGEGWRLAVKRGRDGRDAKPA